jgi:hypothetical protein
MPYAFTRLPFPFVKSGLLHSFWTPAFAGVTAPVAQVCNLRPRAVIQSKEGIHLPHERNRNKTGAEDKPPRYHSSEHSHLDSSVHRIDGAETQANHRDFTPKGI